MSLTPRRGDGQLGTHGADVSIAATDATRAARDGAGAAGAGAAATLPSSYLPRSPASNAARSSTPTAPTGALPTLAHTLPRLLASLVPRPSPAPSGGWSEPDGGMSPTLETSFHASELVEPGAALGLAGAASADTRAASSASFVADGRAPLEPATPTLPPAIELAAATPIASADAAAAAAAAAAASGPGAPVAPETASPRSARVPTDSVWLRFAACSLAGNDSGGVPKENQDAFVVHQRVAGLDNCHLFAVCDGHGPHGAEAAAIVARAVPEQLDTLLGADAAQALALPLNDDDVSKPSPLAAPIPPRAFTCLAEALHASVFAAQERLFACGERFVNSGTTLVAALVLGRHVIVANVGDSRCVLAHTAAGAAGVAAEPRQTWGEGAERPSVTPDTPVVASGTPPPAPGDVEAEPSAGAELTPPRALAPAPLSPSVTRSTSGGSGVWIVGRSPWLSPDGGAGGGGGDRAVPPAARSPRAPQLLGPPSRSSSASSPAPSSAGGSRRPRAVVRALRLTSDHRPTVPAEARRILRHGGHVQPLVDPQTQQQLGPARVWGPRGEDGRRGPGLAMSRSVGDRHATQLGVTCSPTVTYHLLRPGVDRALVLGSDGLWDYLSSAAIARTAAARRQPVAEAARAVVSSALEAWARGGALSRDDITALVLFLWDAEWLA